MVNRWYKKQFYRYLKIEVKKYLGCLFLVRSKVFSTLIKKDCYEHPPTELEKFSKQLFFRLFLYKQSDKSCYPAVFCKKAALKIFVNFFNRVLYYKITKAVGQNVTQKRPYHKFLPKGFAKLLWNTSERLRLT